MFALLLILLFGNASSHTISIDLQSYNPKNVSANVFENILVLSDSATLINITNNIDNIDFFIIQVHTFVENVTLSYNSSTLLHSYVTGTNIGLVYGYAEDFAYFYLFRNIKIEKNVQIMLIINVYDAGDPVPGGCNLSFLTSVAPYQVAFYTDDVIVVNSQPPLASGVPCDANNVTVDMYHLFLGSYDKSVEGYFSGIRKMLTVENIKQHGSKVPTGEGSNRFHRLYSSYRGTGEVFAIIATYNGASSAYVPVVSYGCNLVRWGEDCLGPVAGVWKYLCAVMLLFGLLICFLGHKLFKFTLFTMSSAFAFIVIMLSLGGSYNIPDILVYATVLGLCCGCISLYLWYKFGLPFVAIISTLILTSILIGSVIFYSGLADVYVYNNNVNYWVTFICLMLVYLLLSMISVKGHILSCALLGSYAFVVALNYYAGGNLQYIVINTYRRMTLPHFNFAVIAPPFQVADISFTCLWVVLVWLGYRIQVRLQKNKPPFPHHRNVPTIGAELNERTPLLEENYPPPVNSNLLEVHRNITQ